MDGSLTSRAAAKTFSQLGFERERKIFAGAFGTCYKVRQISDNREFAMKVYSRRKNAVSTTKLEAEIKAELASLKASKSPFVCEGIKSFQSHGGKYHYLQLEGYASLNAMEYVPGTHLLQLLVDAKKGLAMADNIDILLQIILGTQHIHKGKRQHSDLKPENIMIYGQQGNFHVKIVDLGLAYIDPDEVGALFTPFLTADCGGTRGYKPPEAYFLARGVDDEKLRHCGPCWDFWSIGSIFFLMVFRCHPLASDAELQLWNDRTPAWKKCIRNCIIKYPKQIDDRLQKFLADGLDTLLQGMLDGDMHNRYDGRRILSDPFILKHQGLSARLRELGIDATAGPLDVATWSWRDKDCCEVHRQLGAEEPPQAAANQAAGVDQAEDDSGAQGRRDSVGDGTGANDPQAKAALDKDIPEVEDDFTEFQLRRALNTIEAKQLTDPKELMEPIKKACQEAGFTVASELTYALTATVTTLVGGKQKITEVSFELGHLKPQKNQAASSALVAVSLYFVGEREAYNRVKSLLKGILEPVVLEPQFKMPPVPIAPTVKRATAARKRSTPTPSPPASPQIASPRHSPAASPTPGAPTTSGSSPKGASKHSAGRSGSSSSDEVTPSGGHAGLGQAAGASASGRVATNSAVVTESSPVEAPLSPDRERRASGGAKPDKDRARTHFKDEMVDDRCVCRHCGGAYRPGPKFQHLVSHMGVHGDIWNLATGYAAYGDI